ncbi:hypothetical protein NEHOM01_2494, partial [Nematocida homosporus]|uniref:uncharacterized protein n=1 Tax=Nematocida homosporus TaxID=1912981 RepID=UPI00221FD4FE
MTDLTIPELEEQVKALQERLRVYETNLTIALSKQKECDILECALLGLRYKEDKEQFSAWESVVEDSVKWTESTPIARLGILFFNREARNLDRYKQVKDKLFTLKTELVRKMKKEPESEELTWAKVRSEILNIFQNRLPERKWSWISPKEFPHLNAWCSYVMHEVSKKRIT